MRVGGVGVGTGVVVTICNWGSMSILISESDVVYRLWHQHPSNPLLLQGVHTMTPILQGL